MQLVLLGFGFQHQDSSLQVQLSNGNPTSKHDRSSKSHWQHVAADTLQQIIVPDDR